MFIDLYLTRDLRDRIFFLKSQIIYFGDCVSKDKKVRAIWFKNKEEILTKSETIFTLYEEIIEELRKILDIEIKE